MYTKSKRNYWQKFWAVLLIMIVVMIPAVSTADSPESGDNSEQVTDASDPLTENGVDQENSEIIAPTDEEETDGALKTEDEGDICDSSEQTDPFAPEETLDPADPIEPVGTAAPIPIEQLLTVEADDGMLVTVEGSMPADAQLRVETVPQEVAAEFIDADTAIVFAYDIKIMLPDADGWAEYQPEEALTVAVAPCTAAESFIETPVEVTHVSIDDATQQAAVTKVPAAAQEDGAVTFPADSFSYYIGTVSTPLREVALTAGEGYAFYTDAACTELISGEQQISAAAAIYLKAEESYQIQTVTVMGQDGSPGIGLIEPGDGEMAAYDEKITFPAETEPAQPAQLITVQVMQTLWYSGDGFYSDAECFHPAGGTSDLAERVNHTACSLRINMLTYYTPNGVASLDGQDNVVLLTRDASYPGALFTIPSGAQLTLTHITLDGGAIWSGDADTILERGTINDGLQAQAPLIAVEGSLIMSTGATLQNNDNAASPGGAVYVAANGTMTLYDGVISNNTASSKGNGYGGAVYSQAKGAGNQSGLVIAGGYISGNQAAYASTIYRGGSIQLDNATLTVKGGTIAHNKASGSGGGISLAGGSSLIMSGGAIDSNYAYGAGGGIYADSGEAEGCAITMSDGVISNNQAVSNGGGGIYLSPSGSNACTITGGMISANTATTNGGAIYVGNDLLIMSGGTITADNHADGDGSDGFYFYPAGKVILSGSAAVSAPFSRSGQAEDTATHIYIAGGLTGQILIKPHSYDQGTVLASGRCSLIGSLYRDYPLAAGDAAAFIIAKDSFGSAYHAEVDASADQLILAANDPVQLTLAADAANVPRGGSCTITAAASGAEVSKVQWSVADGQSSATLLSTNGNGSAVLGIGADETAPSVTVTAVLPLPDGTMKTSQVSVAVAAELPPAENMVNSLTATAAAAQPAFTVNIPATIPLASEQGSFQIQAQGSDVQAASVTVTVASSGAFTLTEAVTKAALPYQLYRDADYQDEITSAVPTAAVFDGAKTLASIYYKIDTTNKSHYAGTYSDTLTFTITQN